LARFAADGTPDDEFNQTFSAEVGDTLDGYVEKLAIEGSGRIAVGGWFTTPHSWLMAVNDDGVVDAATSATWSERLDAAVLSVMIDREGRLIVGGAFNTPGRHLIRLG